VQSTTLERQDKKMRKLIIALAVVGALAVAGPAGAATRGVNIYGSGFSPKSVTITEGDTVTWVNRDNVNHQVLANRSEFVSPILRKGQSYSFTFSTAGTYNYKDELHTQLTGTVFVKPAPPTLNLASTSQNVVFGTKITLSGTVSSHKPGEQVTIYYQPYPQPNLIQLATLLTAPGGTFSFIVTPQILTTYQAQWKGAYAAPVSVQVQPKLTLGRSSGWLVHAYGGRNFAGRDVQLQRLNAATGQWVTLKKVMLNARSSARVALKLPKGVNKLRLAMSVNQAGAGFLGTVSGVVTWRQRT
jgi:plastocyanin